MHNNNMMRDKKGTDRIRATALMMMTKGSSFPSVVFVLFTYLDPLPNGLSRILTLPPPDDDDGAEDDRFIVV